MIKLTSIPVEARVFEDGTLGVKAPVALPPGTYDAILVVGQARQQPPKTTVVPADLLPLADFVEKARRDHVQRALEVCGGNRTQAARVLGVDPRTVFRFLEKDGPE